MGTWFAFDIEKFRDKHIKFRKKFNTIGAFQDLAIWAMWLKSYDGTTEEELRDLYGHRKRLANRDVFAYCKKFGVIVPAPDRPGYYTQGHWDGVKRHDEESPDDPPAWRVEKDYFLKCFHIIAKRVGQRNLLSAFWATFAVFDLFNHYSGILCYDPEAPSIEEAVPLYKAEAALVLQSGYGYDKTVDNLYRNVILTDFKATGEPIFLTGLGIHPSGRNACTVNPYLFRHDNFNPEVLTWPWEDGLVGYHIQEFTNLDDYVLKEARELD